MMPEGHYQPGWSLIPPKEIDDRDPWSILGYSAPMLIVNGDGATSRSLFMVHPLVLSKDQPNLVKADEEVIRFDHLWKDITSKGSTAKTSGEPQQDEEDDSAHVAEREMTWFIQNVNNLILNPWMVYDIGMVSLHDRRGTRVLQSTGEDVILVRDWDRLTRHQREYFCRRYKLLRPSIYGTEEDPKTYAPSFEPGVFQWMELAQTGYQQFFFIRAWENGRRWAEILTDHGLYSAELTSFLDMCRDPKLLVGTLAFQNLSGIILATQWRKHLTVPFLPNCTIVSSRRKRLAVSCTFCLNLFVTFSSRCFPGGFFSIRSCGKSL